MEAKLIAEEGLLKGQEFPIEEGEAWTIGRDPDLSQLVLEDPSVSREHLLIRFSDDGVTLENLSETNPTEVNDEPVSTPTPLKNGDSVRIGEGYYRFFVDTGTPPPVEEIEEEDRDTIFEEEEEERGSFIDLDLNGTAPWLLKVVSGPNNGAQFSMEQGTSYVIGSDPAVADIVLHDVSVSRQHARITLNRENQLAIEDLGSSNGTLIESKKIEEKETFSPNILISVGTTSFIVYDREGERSTIVSPLLPQIVKILQKREIEEEPVKEENVVAAPIAEPISAAPPPKEKSSMGSFLLASMMMGLVLVVGVLSLYLFQAQDVKDKTYDFDKILTETFIPYKNNVSYTYNPTTGRLVIVGHVLTNVDRNKLLYDVRAIPFIKDVDREGLYVDDVIKTEMNLIISKDPRWKSVILQTPSPGQFAISGYLKTRKDADDLSDFLGRHFPFLDLLEDRIVVEEYIANRAKVLLDDKGMRAVKVTVDGSDVMLTGDIAAGTKPDFENILSQIKQIKGVREVRDYTSVLPPKDTMVDLTGKYTVSGSLSKAGENISVVINGRVYSKGDTLEGKIITKIDPTVIFLESAGIKYRIDYNR